MTSLKRLHWPLVLGLGAFALIRPLSRIISGDQESPVLAIALTVVVSAVWILVVGLGRVAQPVLTVVMAGVAYGVFSIALSGILSPILTGELQGPLAMPVAIIPLLLFNAAWGAIAGALALLLQRVRARR